MSGKNTAIYYAIIVIIVVAAVAVYVFESGLLGSSYNISVTMSQKGAGSITYPYQTSQYTINVTNKGSNRISNLLIGYYLDGIEKNTTTVSIPAGESVVIVKNYTYPTPGPYIFEAVADPGRVLNIPDRNSTQSSITTNVSVPTLPDVYTSIPNLNISTTQSFALNEYGIIGASAMAQRYDIGLVNMFMGPTGEMSAKIFQNIYPFTANAYGAYASYSNNAEAYTVWLQGTINPQLIGVVITSFGLPVQALNESTGTIGYVAINNTTSMCTFYSGGWTKIITYYNNSMQGTCIDLSTVEYKSNESTLLTGLVKGNSNLTHYQSGFMYTNSSILGSSLKYSHSNLTATNIFGNNYGVFISSITKLARPINTSNITNSTCYGLIYSSNGVNVCSYVIPTRTGNYSLPYGLINSSYITNDYILNMYSLVNNTQLLSAHDNAANLMGRIGINGSSVVWNPVYKNQCNFGNSSSIGCDLYNYSTQNSTARIGITNMLPGSIRVNSLNCELIDIYNATVFNTTIASDSSANFTVTCSLPSVSPSVSLVTTFLLRLNYTYGSVTSTVNGTLNVTNQLST